MSGLGRGLMALALVLRLAAGGCAESCPDDTDTVYELRDGTYTGRGPDFVGDYAVDGDVAVAVDADTETITVSFQSAGVPVVLTYDVVGFLPPF